MWGLPMNTDTHTECRQRFNDNTTTLEPTHIQLLTLMGKHLGDMTVKLLYKYNMLFSARFKGLSLVFLVFEM